MDGKSLCFEVGAEKYEMRFDLHALRTMESAAQAGVTVFDLPRIFAALTSKGGAKLDEPAAVRVIGALGPERAVGIMGQAFKLAFPGIPLPPKARPKRRTKRRKGK